MGMFSTVIAWLETSDNVCTAGHRELETVAIMYLLLGGSPFEI